VADDRRWTVGSLQNYRANIGDEWSGAAVHGVIFSGSPGRYSVDLFTARTRRCDESFIPASKTERRSIMADHRRDSIAEN